MKRSTPLALCMAILASPVNAQSIMVSPQEAFASGFSQIPPDAGPSRAIDHSGLLTNFTSGVTQWANYNGGDFCGALHQTAYVVEFWGSVSPTGGIPVMVLDMGVEGLWDRAAIFNEEYSGFGAGPLVVEHGASLTGPWSLIGSWLLTDNPIDSAYGPDVLLFASTVQTQYLRLTTTVVQGGVDPVQISLGEVILGTAGPSPPAGSCAQYPLDVQVPDGMHDLPAIRVEQAPDRVALHLAAPHTLRTLHCVDALGRSVPWLPANNGACFAGLAQGSYAYVLYTTNGATLRGRFAVAR